MYNSYTKYFPRKNKSPKQGTKTVYRGIEYRSKWEVYVAKLLLYSDLSFLYEHKRFSLGNSSYLPDFFIPSKNIYLEVKGVLDEKSKYLLDLFLRTHKVIYLGNNQLKEIHGTNANNISRLDIVNYKPTLEEVERFKRVIKEYA